MRRRKAGDHNAEKASVTVCADKVGVGVGRAREEIMTGEVLGERAARVCAGARQETGAGCAVGVVVAHVLASAGWW